MSLKLTPWLLLSATTLFACVEEKDDTAEDSEPSDVVEPEDSEPEAVETTLDPDSLYYVWSNGYVGNEIADMTFEVAPDYTGNIFTAILYNSTSTEVCIIDWSFDATTVSVDDNYADGSVGSDGLEGWYGFIIDAVPTTRESCDNLGSGQQIFDGLMADQPGFGYGPLNLDSPIGITMTEQDNWGDVSPIVFTGIMSSVALSGGEREYYDINESYAYEVTDGVPAWDPTNSDMQQGTEMAIADVPFAEGFYNSSYFYGFTLTQ